MPKQRSRSAGRSTCRAFTSCCIDKARQFVVDRYGKLSGSRDAFVDQFRAPLFREMKSSHVSATRFSNACQCGFDLAELAATQLACKRALRAAARDV